MVHCAPHYLYVVYSSAICEARCGGACGHMQAHIRRLALHGESVFVSNQDTYNVLRYYTNTSGLSPWAAAWGAHSDRRLTLALWLWHWHWLWLLGIALAGSMPYLQPTHLLTHFIIHHSPGLERIRPV